MAANKVLSTLECPHCKRVSEVDVEAPIDGQGFRNTYRIGDQVDWLPHGEIGAGGRPTGGNIDVVGYVVCEHCKRDYFTTVVIRSDHIAAINIDLTKRGYIGSP